MPHPFSHRLLKIAILSLAFASASAAKDPKPNVTSSSTVHVYKKIGDTSLVVEILRPSPAAAEPVPAAIYLHGGSWTGGSRAQFAKLAQHLTQRGLVSVLVQYRLLEKDTTTPPIVCIQDARSAMRWVRANAADLGIDPKRIVAVGASAGGFLATYLAFGEGFDDPQDDISISVKPSALVLFNPVFDNSPGHWGHERMGEDWARYSPMQMVKKDAPPALTMVGSNDPIATSVLEFDEKMKTVGQAYSIIRIYAGQSHGFFNYRDGKNSYFADTLKEVDSFLVQQGFLPPSS